MVDAKIVEPLEDGVNGSSCPTACNVASVLLFNGPSFKVESHENLLIAPFVGALNAFGTHIQMRLSQNSQGKSIERRWPKLKAYAEASSHSRHPRLIVADVEWVADRVRGLLRTRQSAGPAALEQIREWQPRFADKTDEEIRQAHNWSIRGGMALKHRMS